MRALTVPQEVILVEFADRQLFCDGDVAALGRSTGLILARALIPMHRAGLIEFLGFPVRHVDPQHNVTTVVTRLWRVTPKGRRALRDGGLL